MPSDPPLPPRSPASSPPSSVRRRSVAVLVVIFLAGGSAGASAMKAFAAPEGGPGELPPFPSREIGLTPAQQAQVREVLERNKPRMDQILEEMVPRVRALADDVEAQLVAILTPEQRERYRAYKAGRPPPLPSWAQPPSPGERP